VKAGKLIIARATNVDMAPVKKTFDGMRSAHTAYDKAHSAASLAAERLAKAEAQLGELDATQDASVDAFAVAHVTAGASRTKPLAAYKAGSVSDIKGMPVEKQAQLVIKLATKGKAHEDAGVKRAAGAMEKAAKAVLAGVKRIEPLIEKRNEAIAARDALAPRWEKAFASLKRAVRAAEDEGASGLFAALFEVAE
jgi:hypothetical protein